MNLSFKQIATWILNSASSRAILQKCFYWLVTWLCVIFCSKFLSVLFHTLFFQLWIELGENSKFVKMEKKKLTSGFDRDAKVEGWRAKSEEEENIFEIIRSSFYEAITFFFLNRVVNVPPWSVRRFLAFLSLYIKLFTLAATLMVYSFSIPVTT